MSPQRRLCMFCGKPPQGKNKEHPLPQWLLELTGDPKRNVVHGFDWETGRELAFAFDSFVFPVCSQCNQDYSALEGLAKGVVGKIAARDPVLPAEYLVLLDWLDKVRLGLWFGFRFLQRNAMAIRPNFSIASRLGKKDRMVAVYPVTDPRPGLTARGYETRLFQVRPTAFSLRVNNTLFLSASWDWMCASRCGFPYPQERIMDLANGGLLQVGSFRRRQAVVHPIRKGIDKPCVLLFQPILQVPEVLRSAELLDSLDCPWPDRPELGPLFRQSPDGTTRIGPGDQGIEFDSISTTEATRLARLMVLAYELQNESTEHTEYRADDEATLADYKKRIGDYVRENRLTRRLLLSIGRDHWKKLEEDYKGRGFGSRAKRRDSDR